ncbi:MoaF-related domain-containing protein [Mucilaginibacter sp. X5P1]|uniref:MoaF-related domain-containing protein n=1 Tax=Mucilaginibacter sp. X5P1 TaxID=2723088 RepID=UPI001614D281|nr:hypothetical protein [Mucilaginibacter sp. X5P1]MBB6139366.1 putative alternative tryptophan synthase beta-subunit [Mucilaginibacter sp. X5P1]
MDIIGNKFSVDFGMAKATLYIESGTSLTFTITEKGGNQEGTTETVATEMTELRPQLFMVTWKEKNGNTITQVQDYENGIIYSNWTSPAGEFTHAKGTLKRI